jgi:hypothetical protein
MSLPDDATMRVVWYNGRAFPVTAHPRGLNDPGTHWHVQTEDGEWHAVQPRVDGDSKGEGWRQVMAAIIRWLGSHRSEQRRSV